MYNLKKTVASLVVGASVAIGGVGATGSIFDNSAYAATATETVTVNVGVTLNVRSGPGTNYSSVGAVKGGQIFTGTKVGDWFKIANGSFYGKYISYKYVSKVSSSTIVEREVVKGVSLTVRTGAGTKYSSVGTLKGGDKIKGVYVGSWFRINGGKYSGRYVSGAYIQGTTTTTPPANNGGAKFKGNVTKTLIKTLVHNSPSSSSSWSRTLKPGTAVTGTIQGDWLKLDGGGYVSRALVSDIQLYNGLIPNSRLCDVPIAWNSPATFDPGYNPKTVRKFDCYALKQLTGLENAYKAQFGHYAAIDLSYRPLSEQYFWYDKFGYPRAAMPGTSNHGLGVAIDFYETDKPGEEFGWGGKGYTWLKNNGWKWGFRNTFKYGTWGESYHWDFEGVN